MLERLLTGKVKNVQYVIFLKEFCQKGTYGAFLEDNLTGKDLIICGNLALSTTIPEAPYFSIRLLTNTN